jgi:hypothetical protein
VELKELLLENVIKILLIKGKEDNMGIFSFIRAWLAMRNERLRVCGTIRLIGSNYDKGGVLRQVFDRTLLNLITNAGFDLISNVIGLNAQPSDITHMAIGDGAVGDATATTLTSETDRQTAAYAHTGGTKTFTFTATFTTVVAATEYGCLNAGAAGSLLNTAGFTAITVDSLEIVATITLS